MSNELLNRFSELQGIAKILARQHTTEDLLSSLLHGARELVSADGGTIYLLDDDKLLHFSFVQEKKHNIADAEALDRQRVFEPIPLFDDDGGENRNYVSAIAALDNVTLNIPDVYATDTFQFDGVKKYDQKMHYRTTSMLTVPVRNQDWDVIGVLQLINRINSETGDIEAFSVADQLLAEALSFQAGTYIIHARMQDESEKLLKRVTKLNQIGISLSSRDNIEEMLKEILISAKSLTNADAGTLYLQKDDKLYFEVLQTDSLRIHQSSAQGNLGDIEPIPLYGEDGQPNNHLVSANVALNGQTINIPDVDRAEGYNFSDTQGFDRKNGYRSMSFLTVPMHNKKNEMIGVLQLINAMRPGSREILPFSSEDQHMVESLASMAAVALTNWRLKEDMRLLLESFINVISKAIDEKSPYTGGHCRRVPELAMMIVRAACDEEAGQFADFRLSREEMYEMKIAAMLHDCGKVTTPIHVVDKATKLESIYDRIDLLELRCEIVKRDMLIKELQQKLGDEEGAIRSGLQQQWSKLDEEVAFLRQSNKGSEFMVPEKQQQVQDIAESYTWVDATGQKQPLLTEDEIYNLNIQKGTLTEEEREVINMHITSTIHMLESLPFPKHLRNVPEIAGAHHEHMNGKGYPKGLTGDQMSVQARILCVADIFEALTAADRPYKKAMPVSKALWILENMKKEGHIDPDLFDLFIDRKLYLTYGQKFLDDAQIDVDVYQRKQD